MSVYTDEIDVLYQAARSGEPHMIRRSVSDKLDVVTYPPNSVSAEGLVFVAESGDEISVIVEPAEIKGLINALTEAALDLAEWQAQSK